MPVCPKRVEHPGPACRRYFHDDIPSAPPHSQGDAPARPSADKYLKPRPMPTSPLVSVIIPAYNAEQFIEETLRSARRQTYRNLEILVVDDGSTDATPELVAHMAAGDPRIQLIRQENGGVVRARNRALEEARGRYVAPLDADDLWFPEKIERQVRALEDAGPSAGLAYTWWVGIDEVGRIIGAADRWRLTGDVYRALLLLNFTGNASVPMIRRRAIEELGPYEEQLAREGKEGCEDWDLSLRVAERYQVVAVPSFLTAYRGVDGGVSRDCDRMAASYEIVVGNARRRDPSLPDQLLAWSRSLFYQYLCGLTLAGGDAPGAFRWALRAVYWDPAALTSPGLVRMLLRSAFRSALGGAAAAVSTGDRPSTTPPVTYTRHELEHELSSDELPWAWKSWKPYDRLCLQRLHSLANQHVR